MKAKARYVPVTPAGTPCVWLASNSEREAWDKLLRDAAHMPYKTKQRFQERGYTIALWLCDEGGDDGQ